jgi:ELWxxDGT repeat protein
MKRYIVIFTCSLFFLDLLIAQEKVSNLKNEATTISHQFYWATTGLDTFFLFSNIYKTSVFKAKSRKLTEHLPWNQRALDQRSVPVIQENSENRLLMYKDRYLLEGYSNELIWTDLETGQIWRKITFPSDDFLILSYATAFILENKIYFEISTSGATKFMLVDPETSQWEILNFVSDLRYRKFGNQLIGNQGNSVYSFDFVTKQKKEIYTSSEELTSLFVTDNRLFIISANGEMVGFDINLEQQTKICIFPENTDVFFTADSLVIFSEMDSSSIFYRIYNLNHCESSLAEFNVQMHVFIDFNAATGDFVYDRQGSLLQTFYNYNIYTKQTHGIDSIHSDIGFGKRLRNNVKNLQYYICSSFPLNPGFITQINFEKKQMYYLDIPSHDVNETCFFYHTEDHAQQILQHDPNGTLRWWRVNDTTQHAVLLDSVVYFRSFSGELVTSYSVSVNDRIFFDTHQGIFVIKGHQTELLHQSKPYSPPISYNGKLYHIVNNFPQGNGLLITDENTLVTSFVKFDESNQNINQTIKAGIGFLIRKTQFGPIEKWFDVKTQTFQEFLIEGTKIKPFLKAQNNNLVILDFNQKQYLLNTETNNFVKINLTGNLVRFSMPENNSIYAMHLLNNQTEILRLNEDGESELIKFFNFHHTKLSLISKVLNDSLVVVLVKYPNNLDIIIDNGHDIKIKTYENLNGNLSKVKISGIQVWMEIRLMTGENQLVSWQINETLHVHRTEKNIYLADVFSSQDESVLFFYNFSLKQFYCDQIKQNNDELISEASYPLSQNFSFSGIQSSFLKLSEEFILLRFNDGQKGEEPWIYDSDERKLFLLKDMFDGQHGSNPKNFVLTYDYVYFTALNQTLDRQWYRLNINDIVLVDDKPFERQIILFPNPVGNRLYSKQYLSDVYIYDMSGRQVQFVSQISASIGVDVSIFPSGIYFFVGLDENRKKVTANFVK